MQRPAISLSPFPSFFSPLIAVRTARTRAASPSHRHAVRATARVEEMRADRVSYGLFFFPLPPPCTQGGLSQRSRNTRALRKRGARTRLLPPFLFFLFFLNVVIRVVSVSLHWCLRRSRKERPPPFLPPLCAVAVKSRHASRPQRRAGDIISISLFSFLFFFFFFLSSRQLLHHVLYSIPSFFSVPLRAVGRRRADAKVISCSCCVFPMVINTDRPFPLFPSLFLFLFFPPFVIPACCRSSSPASARLRGLLGMVLASSTRRFPARDLILSPSPLFFPLSSRRPLCVKLTELLRFQIRGAVDQCIGRKSSHRSFQSVCLPSFPFLSPFPFFSPDWNDR